MFLRTEAEMWISRKDTSSITRRNLSRQNV